MARMIRSSGGQLPVVQCPPSIGWQSFPTGLPALDAALGLPGIPKGIMVQVYGPPGAGKRAVVGEMIRAAGRVAVVACGGRPGPAGPGDTVLSVAATLAPETFPAAMDAVADLADFDGLVVVDGLEALFPGDVESAECMLAVRMFSQTLRQLGARLHQSGTTVLFVNDMVPRRVAFGSELPGLSGLRFWSSIRLEVRDEGPMPEARWGTRVKATVTKNKFAPPFRAALFAVRDGRVDEPTTPAEEEG